MTDIARQEQLSYLERAASEVNMRVVPEELAEKAEVLPIVERELRHEKKKRKELGQELERLEKSERDLREKLRRIPVVGPPIRIVEAPIPEPAARPSEYVIAKDCYKYFSKVWNTIKKEAALTRATRVLNERTGLGTELINRSLSGARRTNVVKAEKYVDDLLECECARW